VETATGITDIWQFERFALEQRSTAVSHYDAAYFIDQWRAGGNSYALETRRRIEGRNPALIKEVFRAERILDVGCGPGALIYLLDELGVRADGIDFSPQCRELAPDAVRDRIKIGSLDDRELVPDRSYDLVICREVIEHLTVLQARQLVRNLCRVSSRHIYVTTRFHPNPRSLFDVTHERHVDPTHITCMHKDLLRLLFVLEGFKSRPDLEERMDWLKKDRVLVYEAYTEAAV
jgi:SAM-dependent methyltransferase